MATVRQTPSRSTPARRRTPAAVPTRSPSSAKGAIAAPVAPAAGAGTGAEAPRAVKKPKLVRDGFTMPESDFGLIAALKARAVKAGRETKKSEILRAGLQLLARQDDAALMEALGRLQAIKTGRPRKGH